MVIFTGFHLNISKTKYAICTVIHSRSRLCYIIFLTEYMLEFVHIALQKQIDNPHYLVVTPVANGSEVHCSGSKYVCHKSRYIFYSEIEM